MFAELLAKIAERIDYAQVLMPSLLDGTVVTLQVFFLTLIMALPLGLPIALGSISRFWPLRGLCRTYTWVFRGTPLMLQLFFFYYFPAIQFGWLIPAFPTAVFTFVLNYAAYFAEIYRAGIESIDRGQYEAAQSLGLTRWQTMFGIIIPQTVKRVLPPVANETITLIKDTALVYVITFSELMKVAKGAVNRDVDTLALFLAACIYLFLTFILTKIVTRLENHFSRHEAKGV
jgi:polar amino acid transport system permease protein